MKRLLLFSLIGVLSFLGNRDSKASSTIPLPLDQHVGASVAVFRGTVLDLKPYVDSTDDLIYTRATLRVDEGLKGTFPTAVNVVYRGGLVGNRTEFSGFSPRFVPGQEYVVFVVRGQNRELNCTQGSSSALRLERNSSKSGAATFTPDQESLLNAIRSIVLQQKSPGDDVTDQAGSATAKLVTGMLVDGAGISSRFLPQDRGEPIRFLLDADNLPVGAITVAVASNAVQQAVNAWSAVTSLKFQFDGYQSFGAGADTINVDDSRLRIQLRDNYNRISTTNVLGIGGRQGSLLNLPSGWQLGGRVGTNEFYKTTCGYVVLELTNSTMQNAVTLAEVLCHEIGHALSMAHSSESTNASAFLKDSIMFFQAHGDGRGARLGAYDPPVIQQAYPSNNTPPFSFDRMMDITTASSSPNLPGINEVELRGYDLQSTNLTFQTADASGLNGTFTLVGNVLKYSCGNFGDAPRFDPTDGNYYDDIFFRFSDGTNGSPVGEARVISYNHDSFPADGIPDNWMIANFGNANPGVGINHRAIDDADGDKMINLQEYRAGMDPNQSASAQRLTFISPNTIQFQAKAYELYELLGSTNLTNWARVAVPLVPTTSTGTFSNFNNNLPRQFFRVLKVP